MLQITDHTLPPAWRAVVVSHGVNKGKGRAVLDHVTGAGGTVTDSQSGFRALNMKAALLLAGTLRRGELEAFGIGAAKDIK